MKRSVRGMTLLFVGWTVGGVLLVFLSFLALGVPAFQERSGGMAVAWFLLLVILLAAPWVVGFSGKGPQIGDSR